MSTLFTIEVHCPELGLLAQAITGGAVYFAAQPTTPAGVEQPRMAIKPAPAAPTAANAQAVSPVSAAPQCPAPAMPPAFTYPSAPRQAAPQPGYPQMTPPAAQQPAQFSPYAGRPAPVAPVAAPASQAPAQPAAPVAPTAPVAPAPTYAIDDLARAAAALVDAGKMQDVQTLFGQFQIQRLDQLKPEQYGAFATALRGLGARL